MSWFGFFAAEATKLCNYYVDWSRVGELLRSGNHRYSASELLVRSFILTSVGLSSYLTYSTFSDDESSTTECGSLALLGAMIGFTISHTAVILPLIYKRVQFGKECKAQEEIILGKLYTLQGMETSITVTALANVPEVVKQILQSSLSDEKHARASQTWGRRKRLLTRVAENLNYYINECVSVSAEKAAKNFNQFWDTRNIDDIIESLESSPLQKNVTEIQEDNQTLSDTLIPKIKC